MSQARITIVVGNTGERSRTKVLAQSITEALTQALRAQVTVLEIHQLAPHIATTGPLPAEGATRSNRCLNRPV